MAVSTLKRLCATRANGHSEQRAGRQEPPPAGGGDVQSNQWAGARVCRPTKYRHSVGLSKGDCLSANGVVDVATALHNKCKLLLRTHVCLQGAPTGPRRGCFEADSGTYDKARRSRCIPAREDRFTTPSKMFRFTQAFRIRGSASRLHVHPKFDSKKSELNQNGPNGPKIGSRTRLCYGTDCLAYPVDRQIPHESRPEGRRAVGSLSVGAKASPTIGLEHMPQLRILGHVPPRCQCELRAASAKSLPAAAAAPTFARRSRIGGRASHKPCLQRRPCPNTPCTSPGPRRISLRLLLQRTFQTKGSQGVLQATKSRLASAAVDRFPASLDKVVLKFAAYSDVNE